MSRTAVLLVAALVPAAVSMVDVLGDGATDLVALLAAVLLLIASLASALRDRHAVSLRPDLATWLWASYRTTLAVP